MISRAVSNGSWHRYVSATYRDPDGMRIVEGTLIRLRVSRLPGRRNREPKTVWLWWHGPGESDLDLDRVWRAYLRRFDIEHTFRFAPSQRTETYPHARTTPPRDQESHRQDPETAKPTLNAKLRDTGEALCLAATEYSAWPDPSAFDPMIEQLAVALNRLARGDSPKDPINGTPCFANPTVGRGSQPGRRRILPAGPGSGVDGPGEGRAAP